MIIRHLGKQHLLVQFPYPMAVGVILSKDHAKVVAKPL
jgi:hypothetical protein